MKKTLFLFVFYFIFLEAFSFEGKVIKKEVFKVKSVKIDLPNNGGEWKLIKYRGKKVYSSTLPKICFRKQSRITKNDAEE